jgi:putative molybdopterin biosynthesis protein
MIQVSIRPEWDLHSSSGERLERHCLPLLLAIEQGGRLTAAAEAVGLSYRHAWNLLQRWEQLFGRPLVELERGRGARLTPLGARLVRADQRIRARLTPQLMSLAAEVETEINQALEGPSPLLRMHASHGFAVARLRERLEARRDVRWELQFRGGIDALASLAQGTCELAGFHVPCGELGEAAIARFQPWLDERQCVLPFVIRRQGLILPTGNPERIAALADLAAPGLRFVNRQRGAGTRELFDGLLARAGVEPVKLKGYEHEEYTHSAVAAFVASGMADVGFGVEAAAREFGLDFLPLAEEYYSLLCWRELVQEPPVAALLELLRDRQFQAEIEAVPGYRIFNAGAVWSLKEALARWREGAQQPA